MLHKMASNMSFVDAITLTLALVVRSINFSFSYIMTDI